MLPNFKLDPHGKLGERLAKKNIDTFQKAVRYIHMLPYGRPMRPADYWTIIPERKGTCSSKHAYLKALSEENSIHSIGLSLCIYAMTEQNTPGVGEVLQEFDLAYLLEAHTYLTYDDMRYDFTFPDRNELSWVPDILIETEIDADQIGDYKIEFHKSVLEDWKKRTKIPYSVTKLMEIREQCICSLV